MSDRNEPRTEAGRALLDAPDVLLMQSDAETIGLNEGELELHILAIEAEAAQGAAPLAFCQDCGYAHPVGDTDCIRESEGAAPFDRVRLFDEIDQRFGRNVARFVDARLPEGAAPRAEGLQLGVAAVFQDHRQQGANACYCGWRPNIGEPSWEYHQHLMLKVLKVLGVRDE